MKSTKSSCIRGSGMAMAAIMLALVGFAAPARAQGDACGEADDKAKMVNYSLYYESFKNGDYASALPYLRWMLACAPAYGGPGRTTDKNFERAVQAYGELSLAAEDEATQHAYIDSALAIFDQAVPTLKDAGAEVDEFDWQFKKGRFMIEHSDQLAERQDDIAETIISAYEMDPSRLQPYYINYIIGSYAQAGDKKAAVDFMDDVETKLADNSEVMDILTGWRGRMFTSPQERYDFVKAQLEKNPQDADLLTEAFESALDLENLTEAGQYGDRLLAVSPSARTYQLLARMRLEDGNAEEALELYKKALEQPEAQERARDIYYNMGIAQQQLEQLPQARASFRKALEIDPKFGPAIMGIGDLYVTTVSQCGSAMELQDRAVYWLAVDYFERAKAADPSVANAANRKISTYRKYYPNQEALFFKNMSPGDAYKIDGGCYSWIGESTKVRQP